MSLTSEIRSYAKPAPAPFEFPGIFRSFQSDSLWLAHARFDAIRLVAGNYPGKTFKVGDKLKNPRGVTHDGFVQVTTPVTITFNP